MTVQIDQFDVIFAGVTVGFERLSYSFSEPGAGTSLTRENICVTVSQGALGFPLIIVPQWTALTATGKQLYNMVPEIFQLRTKNSEENSDFRKHWSQ